MRLKSVVLLLLLFCAASATAKRRKKGRRVLVDSYFKPEDCDQPVNRKARKNDKVRVHYNGTLGKHGKGAKFDSSRDGEGEGEPFEFQLGVSKTKQQCRAL